MRGNPDNLNTGRAVDIGQQKAAACISVLPTLGDKGRKIRSSKPASAINEFGSDVGI